MTLPTWLPWKLWKHYWSTGLYFGFMLLLLNDPVTVQVKFMALTAIPGVAILGYCCLWIKNVLSSIRDSK